PSSPVDHLFMVRTYAEMLTCFDGCSPVHHHRRGGRTYQPPWNTCWQQRFVWIPATATARPWHLGGLYRVFRSNSVSSGRRCESVNAACPHRCREILTIRMGRGFGRRRSSIRTLRRRGRYRRERVGGPRRCCRPMISGHARSGATGQSRAKASTVMVTPTHRQLPENAILLVSGVWSCRSLAPWWSW